jgi:hypothetical protein
MRRTIIAKTLAATAAMTLTVSIASTAQAHDRECTDATLKGTFAYTNTGFLTDPPPLAGPFAGVGTQTLDGNGATTATAWVSQNGNVLLVTLTGTYTVNPDCTGTLTLDISPVGITAHAFFVIENDGAEFRAINIDPGQVVTTVARRQVRGDDRSR